MEAASSANRWWENYLVRYLMPSIAGMFAVAWLDKQSGKAFSTYLPFMVPGKEHFDSAALVAWFMFGNLFCYIASYPVLVFHSTRVLDFRSVAGEPKSFLNNPYIWTLLLGVTSLILAWDGKGSFVLACGLVLAYVSYQVARLLKAYATFEAFGFKDGYLASPAYAFLNKLSKRRSVTGTMEDDEGGTIATERERDLASSYRHLREHGNTAFIFVLELVLVSLSYLVVTDKSSTIASAIDPVTRVGILWFVWAIPAMFTHFAGQHLERRFSWWKH